MSCDSRAQVELAFDGLQFELLMEAAPPMPDAEDMAASSGSDQTRTPKLLASPQNKQAYNCLINRTPDVGSCDGFGVEGVCVCRWRRQWDVDGFQDPRLRGFRWWASTKAETGAPGSKHHAGTSRTLR